MSFRLRFTARNTVLVLLTWGFIVLLLRPKLGLWGSPDASAAPSVDKQESEKPKKKTAIVVARSQNEDTTWLEEQFPQWEKYIYWVDNPTADLTVPKNKGRESMVYLTYMIDHYENLPDNVLFVHPTRYQWHNDDPDYDGLPMLRRFQLPYLESQGYVNIRCAWSLGCPAEIKPVAEEGQHREEVHAGGDYKKAFEVLFPGRQVPNEIGVSCCAQFAATRDKIRERSKGEYEKMRDWLIKTELTDAISGRIMEYSWHMIFGKGPVHCPTASECYCKVFGLCDLPCSNEGDCGIYTLPPYSTLPKGWPHVGWDKSPRLRVGSES